MKLPTRQEITQANREALKKAGYQRIEQVVTEPIFILGFEIKPNHKGQIEIYQLPKNISLFKAFIRLLLSLPYKFLQPFPLPSRHYLLATGAISTNKIGFTLPEGSITPIKIKLPNSQNPNAESLLSSTTLPDW